MGLGPVADVTLAEARKVARECRRLVREGVDPIDRRNAQKAANREQEALRRSFEECAAEFMEKCGTRRGWSEKHAGQWRTTLRHYAYPVIGKLSVSDVGLHHVKNVIEPIWDTKRETANRVRSRIEMVLDFAAVSGLRSKENPARWKGNLETLLGEEHACLLYTSPSPRDATLSRMPSSA